MTTRRFFLHFLALTPLANLLNALRKWFSPPADVVNFPDGETLKPLMGTKGGADSGLAMDWWPAVQPWNHSILHRSQVYRHYEIGQRLRISSLFHLQLIAACQVPDDPIYTESREYVRRFRPVCPFGEHQWIVEVIA